MFGIACHCVAVYHLDNFLKILYIHNNWKNSLSSSTYSEVFEDFFFIFLLKSLFHLS